MFRDIRRHRAAAALVTAALALSLPSAVALGGCGGSERKTKGAEGTPKGESEREAAQKRAALDQIPPQDSTAFYQLATTTGLLSARAAAVSYGRTPRGAAELQAATRRVGTLRPRDGDLQRIRDQLIQTLRRAPAAGDTRGARTTLAATSSLILNLQAFTRKHPQYGVLAPD
jgi:hypothetical protein